MGQFNGIVLTDKGKALLAKAQLGSPLIFTRIGLGDGYASQELRLLTRLVHETQSLPILEIKSNGVDQVDIKSSYSNRNLNAPQYVREIGLFAQDPNEGEILYCVANAGDKADFLPQGNGTDFIEELIQLTLVISSTVNVTAQISEKAVVTIDQFNDHVNDKSVHVLRTEYTALEGRVKALESSLANDLRDNLFSFDFSSISGMKISKGWWDKANARLVIK